MTRADLSASTLGTIVAIDPGTTESALVMLEGATLRPFKLPNADVIRFLRVANPGGTLVIEKIEAMGMAVGAEVFETVYWSGRFHERWESQGGLVERVTRRAVKLHLCGTCQAKDSNIRQALIDRYGGKKAAIGRKAAPGPLYGFAGDMWAALAVLVTWCDKQKAEVM